MGKKLTTEEFIKKAKEIHGDLYNYEKTDYKHRLEKVKIICNVQGHGIFEQKPSIHYSCGCPKCGGTEKKTTEEFIKKAKEIHGDLYNYEKVIYKNSRTKVKIICPKLDHGIFEQSPNSHCSEGNGCPKCFGCMRKTTEEFIKKAKEIHGDLYSYEKTDYKKYTEKVKIICNVQGHGIFEQTPRDHYSCGCPKCGGKEKKTTEEFIKKAKEIHGDLYNYEKIDYKSMSNKVKIICNIQGHGIFEQTPSVHIHSKRGCPKCGIISRTKKQSLTKEDFIKKSMKTNKINYNYDNTVYINRNTDLEIMCPDHGIFTVNPRYHMEQGVGCPSCLCPSCKMNITRGKLCFICDPNRGYQKTKEMKIVKFLRENIKDKNFIHNKSVGTNCSDEKKIHLYPDIRFDMLYFCLIIEIDEFKHRGSSYNCEEKRMNDITNKLGVPCIFIRYNPDNKKSNNNKLLERINEYFEYENKLLEKIEDTETSTSNIYEELEISDIKGYKVEYMYYD